MAKVFGYVQLKGEGMQLVGTTSPGPFPIIDLDHQFGVEILDHNKISHWIMKGQYIQLENTTLFQDQYKNACGQFRHVQDVQATLNTIRSLVDTQGMDGNWNYDEYMFGMFNGMELILATLEDREPNYKEKPKFKMHYLAKPIDELEVIADQEERFAQALFEDGDKANSHYRDGYAGGIRKAVKKIKGGSYLQTFAPENNE